MEKDPTYIPKEIEDKPALELAWRGLVISISEGQLTRKQAFEMVHRWDEEQPISDLHDQGPNGDVAA